PAPSSAVRRLAMCARRQLAQRQEAPLALLTARLSRRIKPRVTGRRPPAVIHMRAGREGRAFFIALIRGAFTICVACHQVALLATLIPASFFANHSPLP